MAASCHRYSYLGPVWARGFHPAPSMAKKPKPTKTSRQPAARAALPMELVDIPVLGTDLMSKKDKVWDELTETFWREHPIDNFEQLSEEQLKESLKWVQSVNTILKNELSKLEGDLKSEWLSKEQLLDQLLDASIGTSVK